MVSPVRPAKKRARQQGRQGKRQIWGEQTWQPRNEIPVPSVVVLKFANQGYRTPRELQNQTTPGINTLPMSLDPEIRPEPDIERRRISRSGHWYNAIRGEGFRPRKSPGASAAPGGGRSCPRSTALRY